MTTFTNTTAPVSFEVLLAKMMPHFRFYAKRHVRRNSKHVDYDDVIQELTCMALQSYTSLVQQGKEVFYTPIMQFAIKRYQDGRRFTGSNRTDIHAHQTQILGRAKTYPLSEFEQNGELDEWNFMEDHRQHNAAEAAQWKIDYETWFANLAPRDQSIAKDLSYGYTTGEVAKKYKVSDGLISQYRKRYSDNWNNFIADKYTRA
jgi:RNA polymerase sigma factor (sigma-70 family)